MAVTLAALQAGVAALTVTGLNKIYTSATVPNECFSRNCPVMIPHPDTPLVDSTSTPLTLGLGGGQRGFQRARTAAWVVLTAEVGEARGAYTHGAKTSAVWDALEAALCDFELTGIHRAGPVQLRGRFPVNDHSGKLFFGFDVYYTFLTSY